MASKTEGEINAATATTTNPASSSSSFTGGGGEGKTTTAATEEGSKINTKRNKKEKEYGREPRQNKHQQQHVGNNTGDDTVGEDAFVNKNTSEGTTTITTIDNNDTITINSSVAGTSSATTTMLFPQEQRQTGRKRKKPRVYMDDAERFDNAKKQRRLELAEMRKKKKQQHEIQGEIGAGVQKQQQKLQPTPQQEQAQHGNKGDIKKPQQQQQLKKRAITKKTIKSVTTKAGPSSAQSSSFVLDNNKKKEGVVPGAPSAVVNGRKRKTGSSTSASSTTASKSSLAAAAALIVSKQKKQKEQQNHTPADDDDDDDEDTVVEDDVNEQLERSVTPKMAASTSANAKKEQNSNETTTATTNIDPLKKKKNGIKLAAPSHVAARNNGTMKNQHASRKVVKKTGTTHRHNDHAVVKKTKNGTIMTEGAASNNNKTTSKGIISNSSKKLPITTNLSYGRKGTKRKLAAAGVAAAVLAAGGTNHHKQQHSDDDNASASTNGLVFTKATLASAAQKQQQHGDNSKSNAVSSAGTNSNASTSTTITGTVSGVGGGDTTNTSTAMDLYERHRREFERILLRLERIDKLGYLWIDAPPEFDERYDGSTKNDNKDDGKPYGKNTAAGSTAIIPGGGGDGSGIGTTDSGATAQSEPTATATISLFSPLSTGKSEDTIHERAESSGCSTTEDRAGKEEEAVTGASSSTAATTAPETAPSASTNTSPQLSTATTAIITTSAVAPEEGEPPPVTPSVSSSSSLMLGSSTALGEGGGGAVAGETAEPASGAGGSVASANIQKAVDDHPVDSNVTWSVECHAAAAGNDNATTTMVGAPKEAVEDNGTKTKKTKNDSPKKPKKSTTPRKKGGDSSSIKKSTSSSSSIFPSYPPYNWEMINRRMEQGRYVCDRVKLEQEERFKLLGPYYATLGKNKPRRKRARKTTTMMTTTSMMGGGGMAMGTTRTGMSKTTTTTTTTSTLLPQDVRRVLHPRGVYWDLFRDDVVGMCDAAMARDKAENAGACGTLTHAARKIKESMMQAYEKTGIRHMNEMSLADDRHKFSLAVESQPNTEAAMQSWRRDAFPERRYERLSSDAVCAGLSQVDERIASYELRTNLPDSFVGLSYRYDDTGQSEAWMKSVVDESATKQSASPSKSSKKSSSSSSSSQGEKEKQAALALAADDGVIRAQVRATMQSLLINVQDRVMTEAGVLFQPELRSANWFGDVAAAAANKTEEVGADSCVSASVKAPEKLSPEVVEQPVWGIDCYTRRNITLCLAVDFDEKTAQLFVEKWLLAAINACPVDLANDIANAARLLEGLPLERADSGTDVEQKTQTPLGRALSEKINASGPPWLRAAARQLRLARVALGPDFFRVHPKGHGSVLLCPKVRPNTLITYYRGELYPSWRWGEKMDAIALTQERKDLKPALPDFYNMALERPQIDPRGYGLLFVDASRKAGHGSSLSHSCDPTCEVRVAALKGELCLAMTTIRELETGEELTFNYNAVTESLNEYRSAICLCGYWKCRGSFLHFATADCYQQVLNRNAPIATRFSNLVKGCMKKVMSEDDELLLRKHGFLTAAFGAISVNRHKSGGGALVDSLDIVPVWLRTFVADTLRYIEYERRALPVTLVCDQAAHTSSSDVGGEHGNDAIKGDAADSAAAVTTKEEGEEAPPKPKGPSRPEPAFFYFSRTQADTILARLKEEGFPDSIVGLERKHAMQKCASTYWQTLSEEEKLHWKGQARAEYEKKKAAWLAQQPSALSTSPPSKTSKAAPQPKAEKDTQRQKPAKEKCVFKGKKSETSSETPESKDVSFEDADAEGVSAMEQRIQQLTQTLSRVGRVLDRHREGLLETNPISLLDEKRTVESLRDLVHSPLSFLSDEEVVARLWNRNDGLLAELMRCAKGSPCARPQLLEKLADVQKKYAWLEDFGGCSRDDEPSKSSDVSVSNVRRGLRKAILELRSIILGELKGMAREFRRFRSLSRPTRPGSNKKGGGEDEDVEMDQKKQERGEVHFEDGSDGGEEEREGLDRGDVRKVMNELIQEVERREDNRAAQEKQYSLEKMVESNPWLDHYSQRFTLQATADVLLLYAHTSTFFEVKPYRSLKSTPVEVYARELGNEIPLSAMDPALINDVRNTAPTKTTAARTEFVDNEKPPTKRRGNSNVSEDSQRQKLCRPDDIVAEVTVQYQGDYIVSQLLQWYNAGIGQKPGLPDLLGCALLPSVEGCWSSELLRTNRLKAEKRTVYEMKVRASLIEWMQDSYRRGNPWPEEIRKAFAPKDVLIDPLTKRDASVRPLGSPVIDFLVTGEDSSILGFLTELDADEQVLARSVSGGKLSTVDEGRPAQAVSTWVQCENPECLKWRKIPWHVDVDLLPEKFYCKDNKWNMSANSCDKEEDDWDDGDAVVSGEAEKKEGSVGTKEEGERPTKIDQNEFTVGARFDILRQGKDKYCVGIVVKVDFEGIEKRVLFHFPRLSTKFDEWIAVGSSRISPLHSKTAPKIKNTQASDGGDPGRLQAEKDGKGKHAKKKNIVADSQASKKQGGKQSKKIRENGGKSTKNKSGDDDGKRFEPTFQSSKSESEDTASSEEKKSVKSLGVSDKDLPDSGVPPLPCSGLAGIGEQANVVTKGKLAHNSEEVAELDKSLAASVPGVTVNVADCSGLDSSLVLAPQRLYTRKDGPTEIPEANDPVTSTGREISTAEDSGKGYLPPEANGERSMERGSDVEPLASSSVSCSPLKRRSSLESPESFPPSGDRNTENCEERDSSTKKVLPRVSHGFGSTGIRGDKPSLGPITGTIAVEGESESMETTSGIAGSTQQPKEKIPVALGSHLSTVTLADTKLSLASAASMPTSTCDSTVREQQLGTLNGMGDTSEQDKMKCEMIAQGSAEAHQTGVAALLAMALGAGPTQQSSMVGTNNDAKHLVTVADAPFNVRPINCSTASRQSLQLSSLFPGSVNTDSQSQAASRKEIHPMSEDCDVVVKKYSNTLAPNTGEGNHHYRKEGQGSPGAAPAGDCAIRPYSSDLMTNARRDECHEQRSDQTKFMQQSPIQERCQESTFQQQESRTESTSATVAQQSTLAASDTNVRLDQHRLASFRSDHRCQIKEVRPDLQTQTLIVKSFAAQNGGLVMGAPVGAPLAAQGVALQPEFCASGTSESAAQGTQSCQMRAMPMNCQTGSVGSASAVRLPDPSCYQRIGEAAATNRSPFCDSGSRKAGAAVTGPHGGHAGPGALQQQHLTGGVPEVQHEQAKHLAVGNVMAGDAAETRSETQPRHLSAANGSCSMIPYARPTANGVLGFGHMGGQQLPLGGELKVEGVSAPRVRRNGEIASPHAALGRAAEQRQEQNATSTQSSPMQMSQAERQALEALAFFSHHQQQQQQQLQQQQFQQQQQQQFQQQQYQQQYQRRQHQQQYQHRQHQQQQLPFHQQPQTQHLYRQQPHPQRPQEQQPQFFQNQQYHHNPFQGPASFSASGQQAMSNPYQGRQSNPPPPGWFNGRR